MVASVPQGRIGVSSSSFHIHSLIKNNQTGWEMEAAAPVLVAKSKKLGTALTVASLLAAPFTAGTSLAAGAAARAGMVGVQGARTAMAGRKATQAGKGLQSAQKTSQVAASTPQTRAPYTKRGQAQSMADVKSGKATQLSDFADIGNVTEGTGAKVGVTQPAEGGSYFDNIGERSAEGPQGIVTGQTTLNEDVVTALNNQSAAQTRAKEMNEKLQQAQDAYKESIDTNTPIGAASAVGAYGFNQREQHKKQNEANQKAEMERLEGLAEDARAKASTGTGGKVAVA